MCMHPVRGHRAVAVAQARRPGRPGDCRADGTCRLAGRPVQPGRAASPDQNLLLPPGCVVDLPGLWRSARDAGFATPNIGLLTDLINFPRRRLLRAGQCALDPGGRGDHRAVRRPRPQLRHRRHRPAHQRLHQPAATTTAARIGILGVDKKGWQQVVPGDPGRLGWLDAEQPCHGRQVIGPSFAADGCRRHRGADRHLPPRRQPTSASSKPRRIGWDAFKAAADAQRHATALAAADPRIASNRETPCNSPTTRTTSGTRAGGTARTPIPYDHALLTLERWHAVRDTWPGRRRRACPTPSTWLRWRPTCAPVARALLSRSGPMAAPTPRPACCANTRLRGRDPRRPSATWWSTWCRCRSARIQRGASCAPTSASSAQAGPKFIGAHYQGRCRGHLPGVSSVVKPTGRHHVRRRLALRQDHCQVRHHACPQDPGPAAPRAAAAGGASATLPSSRR